MKVIAILSLLLLSVTQLSGQSTATGKNSDPIAEEGFERLAQWMRSEVAQNRMAGAVVLISRKGQLVYTQAVGKSNLESQRNLTTNDMFKIASMSKVITSVAILQLYEQGHFLLDDPITKYIPELEKMEVLSSFNEQDSSFQSTPLLRPVTIRHLLTHTSGISYGGEEISKIMAKQGFDNISLFSNSLKEFITALGSIPLAHQPGEAWTYGHSTDVLGYLIEQVSGQALPDYLDQHLFTPLQMTSTGFNIPAGEYSRYTQLYRAKGGSLTPIQHPDHYLPKDKEVKLFMGGSGLVSTPEDYMRFAQMLLNGASLNGKRIIDKETIDLMTANQIGALAYPAELQPLLGAHNTFGLGVNVVTEEGAQNEPYSVGSYFWEGMYATSFLIDPKEELVAVFMTQTGTRYPLRKKFREMVYEALE